MQVGLIPQILAGNTAYYRVLFRPTAGVAAVTVITLRVTSPDGTSTNITPTVVGTNEFMGFFPIPDATPNGRWTFRSESVSPLAADEAHFDVVASAFVSP